MAIRVENQVVPLSHLAVLVAVPLLLLSLGSYVVGAVRHFRFKRQHNAYSLPTRYFGDYFGILQFFRLASALRHNEVIEFGERMFATYGPTFAGRVLFSTLIQTIEPENVKAMLATQFADFELGDRHAAFFPTLGNGVFTLDGEAWAHSRALLRPQFSRQQVSDVAKLEPHVQNLIACLPHTTDVQELFYRMTMDSATEFLFGESVQSLTQADNQHGFPSAFNKAQEVASMRVLLQSFYWLMNPPSYWRANRTVHKFVDHYVDLALQAPRHKQDGRYVFSEALAEDTRDRRVMRDQLLNILLAGRDTTAGLLSWTFYLLARDKRVFDKLRSVIVDKFGDTLNAPGKAHITFESLRTTQYLRHVLNEVLRLYPSVPQNYRVANKDTTLPVGGSADGTRPIFVKKGQKVFYNVYAMHRRSSLFGPDASEFRPERWQESTFQWEYLPFNGGPRICLGQQYALTEASYAVVRLLQTFNDIEPLGPEPHKKALLTMSSAEGIHVKLYDRLAKKAT